MTSEHLFHFLQSLQSTLEYATAILTAGGDRVRGGVASNLQQLHVASIQDGMPWSTIVRSEVLMTELQSLIESLQSSDATRPPRRGSVKWYQERQHQPISDGSDITVLQACYWTLYTRHYRGLTERGMDDLCAVLSVGGFLKGPNLMPRCATRHPSFHVGSCRCALTLF